MDFDKAVKHEAFTQTEEAKGLHAVFTYDTSITFEYLENHLKAVSVKWEIPVVTRNYNVWQQKMASNK